MCTGAKFIKSKAGEPCGFGVDVERCQNMIRAVIEIVRTDSPTDLNAIRESLESLLEMAVEGLHSVIHNYANGNYDEPVERKNQSL